MVGQPSLEEGPVRSPPLATILHYTQTWLPVSAGFVHGHIRRSRHRAIVVARDPLENEIAFPFDDVRSLHRLGRLGSRAQTVALTAIALRARVDIVHVHFGYAVGDVIGTCSRLDLPLVLSLHGDDTTALPRRVPDHYRAAAALVAAVIVPSRFLADRAAELGFDPQRISIIPAGVDTELFHPTPLPAPPPTALFVGRMVEKKGIDVLLEAWPRVLAEVPEARLRIIGDGPLRRLIAGAGPSVEHEQPDPSRRGTQIRDAISAATVVVQPSRTAADGDAESMLLVNLEAQATGRAVVSTHHGGIPEFVSDGEVGLLVPEGDAAALASALVEVLADRERAERLGAAGPELVRRFDAARCSDLVDDLYDTLLATRPRRQRRHPFKSAAVRD